MSSTGTPHFHRIVPGASLPGDWYAGTIPGNIVVGIDCFVDSTFSFKQYFAVGSIGLRLGDHVTLWRTSVAVEANGCIEIGDYSYVANASLVCCERIVLGKRVMVAGGVTIADADFHPVSVAARIADTVALSPVGDRSRRPKIETRPVVIDDDVWIGYNATILKGVHIGAGAIIEPGAVVLRAVPAGARVAGNPATVVTGSE